MATWTTIKQDTTPDGHTVSLVLGQSGKGASRKSMFQICRNGVGIAHATTAAQAAIAYANALNAR